jgi:methyl-accepting chemotaxis protein
MLSIMLTPFPDLTVLDIPIGISPQIVMAVVTVLISSFVLFCFIPALVTWWRLKSARSKLNKIHRDKQTALIEKNDLSTIFESVLFQEAWNSFKDTLHEQHDYQAGIPHVTNIRATAPAEAFFSQQSIVDSHINIEFFKHLPGILTGIGIIGTFWGLIHGIQSFDPSLLAKARLDPTQMDLLFNGLKQLFLEVQGAFVASAAAILGAMLVTLLEKILINACYYRLEQLCLKLDALYEGGVAEAYLAALVKSSAENATQMGHLKQALVTDLSTLLNNMVAQQNQHSEVVAKMLATTFTDNIQRQINATEALTKKIQEQIDASNNQNRKFHDEVKEGLKSIGERVENVTSGQGDAVTKNLEQLIEKFSETISSTFNDQMEEVGDMITEAATSMKTMQEGFKTLIEDLKIAGKDERKAVNTEMLSLTTQMSDIANTLKDNTIKLNNASDKMTAGAEQISQASSNFAAAGDKVSGVLEQTSELSTQLMTTGNQMSSATKVLETQLKEYTATRELLGQMISEMEAMLNRAKQEAGMNQQIVADMQKMVSSFGVLKDDMDDFVTQVSDLLANTLTKFENDMTTHNNKFHEHHADTLKQVANAYQPLSASIAGLIDMFAKTNNRGV